jgi:tetratricopeptide (TPR) repeat protein
MNYFQAGLLALLLVAGGIVCAQELTDLNTIQRQASQGDWSKAMEELDKRIAANSNDVESRFLKGLLLLQKGDTAAAREVFLEISQRFPRLPEAYNNLAAIYAADGQYELARQALLSAIANAPNYSPARTNLGDLYVNMALDSYREVLRLNPNDPASKAKLKVLEQLLGSGH